MISGRIALVSDAETADMRVSGEGDRVGLFKLSPIQLPSETPALISIIQLMLNPLY